jgi:hypothetical protein
VLRDEQGHDEAEDRHHEQHGERGPEVPSSREVLTSLAMGVMATLVLVPAKL